MEIETVAEDAVSTAAAAAAASAKVERDRDDRLYKRLSALGSRKGLVAETINGYIREGRVPRKSDLDNCVKELRKFKRYHQALEIMEWMERRKINLAFSDYAKRLDLICKAHGIAAAENFFSGLSPSAKNHLTSGALLNCYCAENMADKALAQFEKMDELKMASTTLAFTNLMTLRLKLGQPEEVPSLVERMKERGIQLNAFTYNVWMQSYSLLNDIEGVERVFQEVKEEGGKLCDWTIYSNLAGAYIKAGLHEKAELALKRLQEEMGPRNQQAFSFLLSFYASISNLDEVHRIWSVLKSNLRVVSNMNYRLMLQSLARLDDIDGLKKCFEEWESTCSSYDTRLANVAIGAYLKHGRVDEAEAVLDRALGRSPGPFSIAWETLMEFHLRNRQMKLALHCMEAAVSGLNHSEWRPKPDNINNFLIYCEKERDVDSAEEFCKYLKTVKCLDYDAYKLLLHVYIAAGRTALDMRARAERDGIEFSPEFLDLLKIVCPE